MLPIDLNSDPGLATVWLLATLGGTYASRITRKQVDRISVNEVCNDISEKAEEINLRGVSSLMYGAVLVYKQKVDYAYKESALVKEKIARTFSVLSSSSKEVARVGKIPLLGNDPCFDVHVDIMFDFDRILSGETLEAHSSGLHVETESEMEDADFSFNSFGEVNEDLDFELGEEEPVPELDAQPPLETAAETPLEVEPVVAESHTLITPPASSRTTFKMRIDHEISVSMATIRRNQKEYMTRGRVTKAKVRTSFLRPLLWGLHPERSTRRSSASSIEHARRMSASSASSVEQARRMSVASRRSETPELDFDLDFDKGDGEVLDFGNDADIDISFDEMEGEQSVSQLDSSLDFMIELKGERQSFEQICPEFDTTRAKAAQMFYGMLETATAGNVRLELAATVQGKSKWELFGGGDVIITK